ncbi:MAG: T9SS type A sorting domain-containing protein, partial [Phycisphaerae bacterium]|nr:T9SS type A sorting domain-containing protein [Saprospiraceae bacterium]
LGNQHQFDTKIVANGVPQPTVPNDLAIAPDVSVEIIYFVQGLQIGQNTVDFDLTNVDGQGDDDMPGNDTGSITFAINPNGFPVQLFFSPNQNPEQSHWEVWDEQNNVVASGGPYPEPFGFYAEQLCLEKDKCYVFHLFDSAGDGMDGGIVDIFSPFGGSYWTYMGGNFGTEITAPFCTQELCAGFLVDAKVECPAPNNGKLTALPINGTAPFQFSLNGLDFQPDPVFSNLSSGFYTLLCVDANGCSAEKLVELCPVSAAAEPSQLRSLKISPNPTSGMANIELPALEGEQSLVCQVFDLKGQLVQTARLVRWDNTLRGMVILDNQPAGTYFLRVKGLVRPLTAKLVKK